MTYITCIQSLSFNTQQWKKTAEWILVQEGISWHRNVWMHPREKGCLRMSRKEWGREEQVSPCLWAKSRAGRNDLCWYHGNSEDTQRQEEQQRQCGLCSVICTSLTQGSRKSVEGPCVSHWVRIIFPGEPFWLWLPAAVSCCFCMKRPRVCSLQFSQFFRADRPLREKEGCPAWCPGFHVPLKKTLMR